jgi:hypothetical protein
MIRDILVNVLSRALRSNLSIFNLTLRLLILIGGYNRLRNTMSINCNELLFLFLNLLINIFIGNCKIKPEHNLELNNNTDIIKWVKTELI